MRQCMIRIHQKKAVMFGLVQAGERTFYIQASAKTGIYKAGGNDVYLIGSTVRSYLAWLKDREEICGSFEDNQLLWNTVL